MKTERRGRKPKPKEDIIKFFSISGRTARIEQLGGVVKVRELIENHLKLKS